MFPRTITTRLLIILTATLLLAGPLVRRSASADEKQLIHVGWKRPSAEPFCLTMTQDGKFSGSVDKSGMVRFCDEKGTPIWEKHVKGATDMLIARNGQSVLVYSKLNPVYTDVYFFRGNGAQLWKQHVDGSIWAGAVSSDGNYAAVTTGTKYVYSYSPDPRHPKFRRWRINGIGRCLAFTPDSQNIIIGTWQKAGLICYTRTGTKKWSSLYDAEKQYDLKVSLDGKMIMGLIPGRPLSPRIQLGLWTYEGKPLWEHALPGYDARALISPASQFVALSFASTITHGSSEMTERKIAVYKSNGGLAWQKGGLFFGPRLVALSPKGSSVIVSDGDRSLYNIEYTGKISSKLVLGGTVQKAISTDDGHKILLHCTDGEMYLLNVG